MVHVSKANFIGETKSRSTNTDTKEFPKKEILEDVAKSLNISVDDLKKNLRLVSAPDGKGIYSIAKTNNMDVQTFCQLNGIDYASREDYTIKKGEQFYVINNPTQCAKKNTSTQEKTTQKNSTAEKTQTTAKNDPPEKNNTSTPSVEDNQKRWNSYYTPEELGHKIYDVADNHTKAVGKPDFDALIEQINPKNVIEVLETYNDNPNNKKESLIKTICRETGSEQDARKDAVMHIYDALASRTKTDASYRASFEKELNDRFAERGFVNTDRMDEMLVRMIGTPKIIAEQIEKEVDSKTGAVKGKGEPFYDELIAKINENNVIAVLEEYKKLDTGETLINAIASEYNSDPKTERQLVIQHIFNAYANNLGTPQKVRELFAQELSEEAEAKLPMSTSNLDKYMDYMTASPETIASNMEALIDNNFIKGAVDKREFQVLLNLITKNNVVDVMKAYENIEGNEETLLKGITSEWGDDEEPRKNAVMHIYNSLAEKSYTPPSNKQAFEAEMNSQFDKTGKVNTEKLDAMLNQMITDIDDANTFIEGEWRFEPPKEDKTVKLHNGKTFKQSELIRDAINGADREHKQDHGVPFAGTIRRPIPNLDDNNRIVPSCEILNPPANKDGLPLEDKVIILNTGHTAYKPLDGAFDAGSTSLIEINGKKESVEEWQIADKYTRELAVKLQARGATVMVISGTVIGKNSMADVKYFENFLQGKQGPQEARDIINATSKSNMAFMSIHLDSFENMDRAGFSIRPNTGDSGDIKFSKLIKEQISNNFKDTTYEKLTQQEIKEDPNYVVKAMGKDIPATLIELGNIQNGNVVRNLLNDDFRDIYTNAFAQSFEDLFK